MSDIWDLRAAYVTQHAAMNRKSRGDITKTTRRQAAFRPRGNVYRRLLALELRRC